MSYSLPLIAEVWIQEPYKDKPDSRKSTTREEYRKLQVLQNKIEKVIYSVENSVPEYKIKNKPTEDLLRMNGMQSIHQMGAQCVLNMYRKMIMTEKPRCLYEQLSRHDGRHGQTWKAKNNPRLTVTSSKIIEKGTRLWNRLDAGIKDIPNHNRFRRECKKWTLKNIPIKPG